MFSLIIWPWPSSSQTSRYGSEATSVIFSGLQGQHSAENLESPGTKTRYIGELILCNRYTTPKRLEMAAFIQLTILQMAT